MFKTKKSLLSVAVIASTLGLTACGGSSNDSLPTPTPTPSVNRAPTDITLSASNVSENVTGAAIGTLSATDADTADTFTFAVNDDRFEIDGAALKLKAENALNFEQETSVTLSVTVTDSASATFSKDITVSVDDLLDYYDFESKAMPGESSVSYSGQIARQLLISDLFKVIGAELSDATTFDTNSTFINREAVINALNSYFDVADYDVASQRTLLTTTTPSSQTMLTEISSSSKDLVGKIAGNDATGQHKDWNSEFAGWGAKGSTTPEGLVRTFFGMLADNAQTQLDGTVRQDPFGNDITNISLTSDGRDLKQLIQKFLSMSVSFSQGVDDYLDNDIDGKGLLSDHTDTAKAYTDLEHQFDEGFGYFGAARDYLDYSDEEVATKGGRDDWQLYHDTNGDGSIDFNSEYNFGHSTNASKRDRGATVANDFSKQAMDAFLQGRKLLNDTAGVALTDGQKTELYGYRDTAVLTWEKAIAATVVHYINDVDADLGSIGTDDFSYADTAKHWSEMKGFALGLQFNKATPLSDTDFITVHTMIGDMPVLTGEVEVSAYRADLLIARDLLQAAYAFDAENAANW
ncbi:DUF4856 domain-containing protein [Paraglaciecola psychrophila]|uniref:Cadherin n=1 Tax=Paraglaciecola psychrophila 170 TaxID=1129794 RepID=K7AD41_9ALTE|nr:DUF4856 domain-containing protein [Paraglaciecola psychrophila]AGH46703.1 cadherin [Paraglaciecola psychrophila 170]GAC38583.1 conserved hypothetical protein [Paraglaciecola psychrophila 170]